MTLIGALKCKDGFVIASDTAIELGDAVYQGHKIARYRTEAPDDRYELFVACCGEMGFAEAASQKIRDGLKKNKDARSLAQIRSTIEQALKEFYDDHMWPAVRSGLDARMSLVMAVWNALGEFGVFKTHHSTLKDSNDPVFDGTGEPVAMFLPERLLRYAHAVTTAVAVNLFAEIFKVAKKNSAGVGRNTEIYAVRVTEDADKFFGIANCESLHLWALEENLYTGIRAAFDRDEQLSDHCAQKLSLLMQAICNEAKGTRRIESRVIRLTEGDDRHLRMETIDPYILNPSLQRPTVHEPPPEQSSGVPPRKGS